MIKRRTACLRLSCIGLATTILFLAEPMVFAASPADRLIDAIENRYNRARTLSVLFTEVYSVQGHQRPAEEGRLTLRKQGKMRWDYTRPAGKLFISDGKDVFLYTAGDNRVEKIPLKGTEDFRAPLAFLLGHLDMKKEFRNFRVEENDGVWLSADARSETVPYEGIDMRIAGESVITRLKIHGRDGSLVSYDFRDEVLNPPVPDSLFHFTPPPGAEVVDAIEPGSGAQ
jgi:outer membrane lipoprotein carrier protein